MTTTFTPAEQAILRIVQSNLPDSLTPYADIAQAVGCEEATVIGLLQRLKEDGAIRRFGASIKHQKTVWKHNAMVAWRIDDARIDACGAHAAKHPHISHCYHRPSNEQDWPYTLYTMIHGRSRDECLQVVEELRHSTDLEDYAILESLQELKKISMTYF